MFRIRQFRIDNNKINIAVDYLYDSYGLTV
jgi:hypothetical protein